MAITDAYFTPQEARAYGKPAERGVDDVVLEAQILGVCRFLDRELGWASTGFNRDSAVTTRVYAPDDEIDPIASLTGLVVRATTASPPITWASVTPLVLDTDFELLPRNAAQGAEPRPWTTLRLFGWTASPVGAFEPKYYQPSDYRVQVTAIHGWPAVPPAIKWKAIELLDILRGKSIFATEQITDVDTTLRTSIQARGILRGLSQVYSRYPVAVA